MATKRLFRWQNDKIIIVGLLLSLILVGGFGIFYNQSAPRAPAGTSITDFPAEQADLAEWSVSSQDFSSSDPGRGRSYFDYVFSDLQGATRTYQIPYPFEKALGRVDQYLGYENRDSHDSGLRIVLFPMGRSLQRNAALIGAPNSDLNLFFRFPRVVVGVDKEPKIPFALNLKGRLFLGFHEKSKVIEAISYNDEEGRYEYQVVRDYEAGKKPKVVYANRQLCLSCHQNQTPIFSQSPWGESNAHPQIFSMIEKQLGSRDKYFGAATRVDLSVPYALDVLVDKGNYSHAYNKMWLKLCSDSECQKKTVQYILRYLLNGQEGLRMSASEKSDYLLAFEKKFQQRFPHGIKIPSPKIPNRDPLKDRRKSQSEIEQSMNRVDEILKGSLQELISRSSVSGEFEPLMVRPAVELWASSEPDGRNMNKMISGLAEMFTQLDAQQIEGWLEKKVLLSGEPGAIDLQASCQIQKTPQGDNFVIQVSCPSENSSEMALQKGYFVINQNQIRKGMIENLFLYGGEAHCDRQAVQSVVNRVNAIACPALSNAEVSGTLNGDILDLQFYQANKGLKARLLDGRLLTRVQLDLKMGKMKVSIVNDISYLDKLTDHFPNALLNRKTVLKILAEGFKVKYEDPDIIGKMKTLEKNLEIETLRADQILAHNQNPVEAFTQSCGMCHSNFEGVPPAFLGLKPSSIDAFGKCVRIEMCAPRILYRLKMRNCPDAQIALFQKNPMPLPNFFEMTKVDMKTWQKSVAPRLIQFATRLVDPVALESHIRNQGVDSIKAHDAVIELTTKDCPQVDYQIYENLPRCEFSQLKLDSLCPELIQRY